MLAGPIIGNLIIWLLTLLMAKPEDKPTPCRPQPRSNGPERIPIRRNKSGTALSDFVRAMREEDAEPPRIASTLTPGIPTRLRIPSPKPMIRTPLFPLSAPLSDETAMTPRNPHFFTFSRPMGGSFDMSISKSPHAPIRLISPFPPFQEEDEDENENNNTSERSPLSPPSYSELIEDANSVPIPQSPVIQENLQSHTNTAIHQPQNYHNAIAYSGASRRLRFTPHMRVVSTGAQLFPVDEQNPLSPNIDLPTPPNRPAVWVEEDEGEQGFGTAW